jgi:hypothetical protein
VEANLPGAHVVVISQDTPDGGRAGVPSEVTRAVAAKRIVEGSVRLATPEEADAYRQQINDAKRAIDQQAAANRVQLRVISDADLRALQGNAKKT